MSYLDELEQLSRLRQSGALTEEEFQNRKARLTDDAGASRSRPILIGIALVGLFIVAMIASGVFSVSSSSTENLTTAQAPREYAQGDDGRLAAQSNRATAPQEDRELSEPQERPVKTILADQREPVDDYDCTGVWKASTPVFDHFAINVDRRISLLKDRMVVLEGESFSQNAVEGLWGLDDTAGQYTIYDCSQRSGTAKIGVLMNDKETVYPAVKDATYFN